MLSDLRVLDFSRYIAGPYCASILGDLGAEVIRIEPVGGGEDRGLVPVTDQGTGALFLQTNRNKKSVAIDMTTPEGRAIIERLIATADIVVTNMPPGALKRHGLDYETLKAIRPDIIATNVSAFGTEGPLAEKTGFDAVAQGMSGAAYLSGNRIRPARSASSYVDYATGLAGAMGTLAAVIHRGRTGQGQAVRASLLATALTFINAAHIEESSRSLNRRPFGNRSPYSAPSDIFPTTDGAIVVQVVGNPMFRRWARLVGQPDLLRDRRFTTDALRGRNGAALSRIMRDWTGRLATAEALDKLAAAGIPAGPVYSPRQTLDDPGIAATGILKSLDLPDAGMAIPLANLLVQLDTLPETVRSAAPAAGQHTAEILGAAGYSPAEVADMARKGLISQ